MYFKRRTKSVRVAEDLIAYILQEDLYHKYFFKKSFEGLFSEKNNR